MFAQYLCRKLHSNISYPVLPEALYSTEKKWTSGHCPFSVLILPSCVEHNATEMMNNKNLPYNTQLTSPCHRSCMSPCFLFSDLSLCCSHLFNMDENSWRRCAYRRGSSSMFQIFPMSCEYQCKYRSRWIASWEWLSKSCPF